MIDWVRILQQNSIEFVDSGPSTAKGNVYVRCPFCGSADQGYHMGISVRGKGWGCWKNRNHRGKSPAKLLSALLDISYYRAQQLLGSPQEKLYTDAAIGAKLRAMLNTSMNDPAGIPRKRLAFPPEIKPLNRHYPMFSEYLLARGYSKDQVLEVVKQYGLHVAVRGLYAYRLVFPVYTVLGLTTWTGRTIVPKREPRYLTLSTEADPDKPDRPVALATIKDCLFNERWLQTQVGRALIVCEGPFDAMRMDYFGRPYNIHATCMFGKVISDAQVDKLYDIAENYQQLIMILDPDAAMDRLAMWDRIRRLGFRTAKLDGAFKDPADMAEAAVHSFFRKEVYKKGS